MECVDEQLKQVRKGQNLKSCEVIAVVVLWYISVSLVTKNSALEEFRQRTGGS